MALIRTSGNHDMKSNEVLGFRLSLMHGVSFFSDALNLQRSILVVDYILMEMIMLRYVLSIAGLAHLGDQVLMPSC